MSSANYRGSDSPSGTSPRRSLLPRLANDNLAKIFLDHGASLWLLQTYQVGGWDDDIEPITPTKLWI